MQNKLLENVGFEGGVLDINVSPHINDKSLQSLKGYCVCGEIAISGYLRYRYLILLIVHVISLSNTCKDFFWAGNEARKGKIT